MEILQTIRQSDLTESMKIHARDAILNGKTNELLHLCRDLWRNSNRSICREINLWFLKNISFEPELSVYIAQDAQEKGDFDEAYFYFFNAYHLTKDIEVGEKFVRLLKHLNADKEVEQLEAELRANSPKLEKGSDNIKVPTIESDRKFLYKDLTDPYSNFIVSDMRDLWLENPAEHYLADPFLAYRLQKSESFAIIQEAKIGVHSRSVPDDMERDLEYILHKQSLYLDILIPRLNQIHRTSFSKEFWRRALGLCFERCISQIYDMFRICEAFDPVVHVARILSQESYYVPLDFDEQRYLIEHWSYGREQLFSCYIGEFYPNSLPELVKRFESRYSVREIYSANSQQPVVGIMGAWFAPHFHQKLIESSAGRFHPIGFSRQLQVDRSFINKDVRNFLFEPLESFDRFDRYIFRCLNSMMPQVFIEFFNNLIQSLQAQFAHQANLKYVVSELWVGEAYEPIALAFLKETLGVKTIYNEHNCNIHAYKANIMPRWASYCDIYAAHGDYGSELPNVISLGSLYDFGYSIDTTTKSHHITYVSGLSLARNADYSCFDISEGYCENAGPRYEQKRRFFKQLSPEIKSRINYRGYPFDAYLTHWEAYYDDRQMMKGLLDGIKFDDMKSSGKEVMGKSKLVIIDYLMTSHLESLSMNIPTVILFFADFRAFRQGYSNYLQDLTDAGICQTDPTTAAAFIERIYQDPNAWWEQSSVQNARNKFLSENLGNPQAFFQYLLNLSAHGN